MSNGQTDYTRPGTFHRPAPASISSKFTDQHLSTPRLTHAASLFLFPCSSGSLNPKHCSTNACVCTRTDLQTQRQQRNLHEMSDSVTVEHNKHSHSNEHTVASKGCILLTAASLCSATTSRLLISSEWSPRLKITQLPTCDAECLLLNKSSKRASTLPERPGRFDFACPETSPSICLSNGFWIMEKAIKAG